MSTPTNSTPTNPSPGPGPLDPTSALPLNQTQYLPAPPPSTGPATAVPDDAPVGTWAASGPAGPSYPAPNPAPAGAPTVIVNRRPRIVTILFGLIVIGLAVSAARAGVGEPGVEIGRQVVWLGANLAIVGAVGLVVSRVSSVRRLRRRS